MNHLKFHPIDYKNASYYGGMKESSRHGNGMLITDDSYILIGNNLFIQLIGMTTKSMDLICTSLMETSFLVQAKQVNYKNLTSPLLLL